jgi:hypothetical protein
MPVSPSNIQARPTRYRVAAIQRNTWDGLTRGGTSQLADESAPNLLAGGVDMSDDAIQPECRLPPMPSIGELMAIPAVQERLRLALKYEPSCHALNALTERALHGETPLPQEVEDAKKALEIAGWRCAWTQRDYAPGVYGIVADEDKEL